MALDVSVFLSFLSTTDKCCVKFVLRALFFIINKFHSTTVLSLLLLCVNILKRLCLTEDVPAVFHFSAVRVLEYLITY